MLVALTVGAMSLMGRSAEAQARGTLQATATVVDTRQGFEALTAVRQVLTDSKAASANTVATVAHISTARPSETPQTVVVTIDYSRN
jgi:hypothetical protein